MKIIIVFCFVFFLFLSSSLSLVQGFAAYYVARGLHTPVSVTRGIVKKTNSLNVGNGQVTDSLNIFKCLARISVALRLAKELFQLCPTLTLLSSVVTFGNS